jgi:hypothetical protein
MNAVEYTFAAIVDQDADDPVWIPRLADASGAVAWDEDDGPPKRLEATGIRVYFDRIALRFRMVMVRDVDIQLYVTRTRLVADCRRYDKGGAWIGTLLLALNAASMARARICTRGKFLVAQLWWPWLSLATRDARAGSR